MIYTLLITAAIAMLWLLHRACRRSEGNTRIYDNTIRHQYPKK